ncbi:MAG TPA: alpha/beta fold hydrolase [Dehalococcoidia bacterium]|nr:alpha/beta fold hydrolase [Dehalococcoidia bacterium]
MPTIDRGGVKIYYEAEGEGYPVLFTHGYSATAQMWQPQREALGSRYRFITWDMRGHGRTDSPAQLDAYSEAETVADIAAILDAEGAEQAVIGGLSLGGYMTLGFWQAHPQRCRALVLCDTGPGYRNPTAREQWNETAEQRAVALETRGFEALGRSPEVAQTAAGHRTPQGLANAARGMLKQFDARVIEGLPQISVPTLIIVGENDRPYLAGTDYMAAKIPGARKVVIANAGHASNIDQPAAFNDALLGFLSEVGIPSRAKTGA